MKKSVILFLALIFILFGCSKKKEPVLDNQLKTKQDTAVAAPKPQASETVPHIDSSAIREEQLQRDAKVALRTIYFNYDAFLISDESRNTLVEIGKFMKKYSDVKIKIEGHCDERGSSEYNMALGQKRADEAKKYLVTYGVSSNRFTTISWGEERPAVQGETEEAWAKNRRDEFSIDR